MQSAFRFLFTPLLEQGGCPMQTSIRPAAPEDAAEVVALIRLLAADNGEATALTPDYARLFLSDAERGAFLVEADGVVAGLLS